MVCPAGPRMPGPPGKGILRHFSWHHKTGPVLYIGDTLA